jgi:hypothetical protein
MLLRSLNLRRLALVLFTGEKNHFLIQLPAVQEKLVDILRNVPSPLVQCEVYLCIRVLLCRLAAHSMTSFWPVILTELVRCACLNWHSKSNLNCSTEYLSKYRIRYLQMAQKIYNSSFQPANVLIYCSLFKRKSSKCTVSLLHSHL